MLYNVTTCHKRFSITFSLFVTYLRFITFQPSVSLSLLLSFFFWFASLLAFSCCVILLFPWLGNVISYGGVTESTSLSLVILHAFLHVPLILLCYFELLARSDSSTSLHFRLVFTTSYSRRRKEQVNSTAFIGDHLRLHIAPLPHRWQLLTTRDWHTPTWEKLNHCVPSVRLCGSHVSHSTPLQGLDHGGAQGEPFFAGWKCLEAIAVSLLSDKGNCVEGSGGCNFEEEKKRMGKYKEKVEMTE